MNRSRTNRDGAAVGDSILIGKDIIADPIPDGFKVVGAMHAMLFDEHGALKEERSENNLIVTMGRDAIIERLDSSPTSVQPTHMAIGTGATAPVAGNVLLGAEIDRNALTSSVASGGVLTMIGNWAAGDGTNAAITEAGIFSIVTANTSSATNPMYARATFTAINKGVNDTLQITWTFTLTPV